MREEILIKMKHKYENLRKSKFLLQANQSVINSFAIFGRGGRLREEEKRIYDF